MENEQVADHQQEAVLRTVHAEMIRKVYEVDPLVCPPCGGRTKVVSENMVSSEEGGGVDPFGRSWRRSDQQSDCRSLTSDSEFLTVADGRIILSLWWEGLITSVMPAVSCRAKKRNSWQK
jgi:hypothetical protein